MTQVSLSSHTMQTSLTSVDKRIQLRLTTAMHLNIKGGAYDGLTADNEVGVRIYPVKRWNKDTNGNYNTCLSMVALWHGKSDGVVVCRISHVGSRY